MGLGAICYSSLLIFTRLIEGMSALSVAFFRAFFAFLFFIGLSIIIPQKRTNNDLRGYLLLTLLGVLMGVTAVLYIYAIQNTTVANASLLVNSAPIYIAILSPIILKDVSPKYKIVSVIILWVGMVLLTNPANLDIKSLSFGGVFAGFIS